MIQCTFEYCRDEREQFVAFNVWALFRKSTRKMTQGKHSEFHLIWNVVSLSKERLFHLVFLIFTFDARSLPMSPVYLFLKNMT